MHWCKTCKRVSMKNGHKTKCPKCGDELVELKVGYMEWTNKPTEEREKFIRKLEDEKFLNKHRLNYRMHRYTKWYAEEHPERSSSRKGNWDSMKTYAEEREEESSTPSHVREMKIQILV